MTPTSHPYHVIAYFAEGAYRRYTVKSMVDTGSASKLTLINYAFGIPGPDPATGAVVTLLDNPSAAYAMPYSASMSVDGQADDPQQPLRGHFNQLRKLKALYPGLKIVLSLGGWTGSGWFSDAARTAETRHAFVKDCLDRYILGNLPVVDGAGGPGSAAGVFDGIDLDWEYPIADGLPENHYHPADGENYVLLLKEFRDQYAGIGRPDLLLTMAGPSPAQAEYYRLAEGHPYLDLITIMTYDLHGSFDRVTNHHTNLCPSPDDPSTPAAHHSADRTIRLYRDGFGIPASKLLVGAAFYGRAWRDVPPEANGLYQPGVPGGVGEIHYRDLVRRMGQGFQRFWDDKAYAPWLYSPSERIFISCDDTQSIAGKVEYVKRHGLGGIMFWEISGDDEHGGLVDAIDRAFRSNERVELPCE